VSSGYWSEEHCETPGGKENAFGAYVIATRPLTA